MKRISGTRFFWQLSSVIFSSDFLSWLERLNGCVTCSTSTLMRLGKAFERYWPWISPFSNGWQVSKRGFFSNLRKHPFRLQKFMQFKVTRLSFFFSSQDLETILEDYPQEKGSGPQLFHKTTEHPLWAISGCFTIWNLSGMSGTISVLNHVDVPKLRHMLEVIATMMREAELSIVFQIPDVLFLFTIVV